WRPGPRSAGAPATGGGPPGWESLPDSPRRSDAKRGERYQDVRIGRRGDEPAPVTLAVGDQMPRPKLAAPKPERSGAIEQASEVVHRVFAVSGGMRFRRTIAGCMGQQ